MRFFLLLSLFVFSLCASQKQIEIYAGGIHVQGNTFFLEKEIIVLYEGYILNAKKAKYDKDKGVLELFGNVIVSNNNHYKILGNYAKLNIKQKRKSFRPFYLLDETTKTWLSAQTGCDSPNSIDISKGTLSGCDPTDPLWQIEFSSSKYNKQTKFLNLYNAVFYIYDIPVLYTPYIGYSFDTRRRSGLLSPSVGYSSDEGVYYEQPIYIAEQNWWDMEFRPQVRTDRGYGLYGTFRFVDSKYSYGELNFGYFKEKERYYREKSLANKEHYGINFLYTNSNILKSIFDIDSSTQSVLYIDTLNMNDVDYINLATNDTTKTATPLQTISRANLFFNNEKNYFGTYLKYYSDLKNKSNAKTIQQLPSLQYHRYLDTLLSDHLLYNFNIQSTYLYRPEGTTAVETNIDVPIKLRTSLFDEYLNLALESYIYGQYSTFGNDTNISAAFEDGYYLRNYNLITLSTQLTKPYQNFIHTLSLSSSYIKRGSSLSSGFFAENEDVDCKNSDNEEVCTFYKLGNTQEALSVGFSQYFYNKKGKQVLYHRLSDIISDPGTGNSTVGEIENELDVVLNESIKYYNNSFYNFTYDTFSKILNKISYNAYGFNIALSHFYKKNFSGGPNTSYITSSLKYRYNIHYSYTASYDYDIENNEKKRAEIGFLYQKRCWNFGLRYAENNRPILNSNNEADSVYDRYIYFTVVLKPLMKPSASDFFGLKLPKTLTN